MRAILFDFDYTLADSSQGITTCFQAGLRGIGLPPADPESIRRTIGKTLPDSLAEVAGEAYREHAYEFRRHWRAMSQQVMVDQTKLFEPVPAALQTLRDRGRRLAIISTKWRRPIEDVLARHQLSRHFEAVIGGDDVEKHKPHPEGLQAAMAKMRLAAADAVYVGDSVVDGETAQRAGVSFIAVLTGVTPKQALEPFQPTAIIETLEQLPDLEL